MDPLDAGLSGPGAAEQGGDAGAGPAASTPFDPGLGTPVVRHAASIAPRAPGGPGAGGGGASAVCGAGLPLVWGLGPDATWLGLGGARPGGRGATPDTRGDCRRSGHRRWSGDVAVAPGHAGRGLWPSWTERRRAARPRGGARAGAGQGGAPLRVRGVPTQGRAATATVYRAAGGGGGA